MGRYMKIWIAAIPNEYLDRNIDRNVSWQRTPTLGGLVQLCLHQRAWTISTYSTSGGSNRRPITSITPLLTVLRTRRCCHHKILYGSYRLTDRLYSRILPTSRSWYLSSRKGKRSKASDIWTVWHPPTAKKPKAYAITLADQVKWKQKKRR